MKHFVNVQGILPWISYLYLANFFYISQKVPLIYLVLFPCGYHSYLIFSTLSSALSLYPSIFTVQCVCLSITMDPPPPNSLGNTKERVSAIKAQRPLNQVQS